MILGKDITSADCLPDTDKNNTEQCSLLKMNLTSHEGAYEDVHHPKLPSHYEQSQYYKDWSYCARYIYLILTFLFVNTVHVDEEDHTCKLSELLFSTIASNQTRCFQPNYIFIYRKRFDNLSSCLVIHLTAEKNVYNLTQWGKQFQFRVPKNKAPLTTRCRQKDNIWWLMTDYADAQWRKKM